MIVDDESKLRFVIKTHLQSAGFAVIETSDGATAIQLAADKSPDLILMDIGLPRLNGVDATRALKSDPKTADIPIIMLTARSETRDVVHGLEAGAQEYLTKPFEMSELLARVRAVHKVSAVRQDLDRLNSQLEAEVDEKNRRLMKLYEFMRDLNHAGTRDEVLDLLIRCLSETIGAKRISIFLIDHNGQYLVCERAHGLKRSALEPIPVSNLGGITSQVINSGKTLSARTYGTGRRDNAEHKGDAFVSAPLVSTSLETPNGVLGVVNVTEKPENEPFSEEEIDCIRSVADAAAIALGNVTSRLSLQQSVRVLLRTLAHLAEYRDEETTLHIERVGKMSKILAQELQRKGPYRKHMTSRFIEMLVQAAPMHDIGKVGVPDEILTKPGTLTDEEFQIMKTHTDIGRRVLSRAVDPACPVPLLKMCVDIAHGHHERFDGKGYPQRLKSDAIPLSARIISLVDAYDAITSRRRYKNARSHEEAVAVIREESSQHFDPVLVEAFLRCHEKFEAIRQRLADEPELVASL